MIEPSYCSITLFNRNYINWLYKLKSPYCDYFVESLKSQTYTYILPVQQHAIHPYAKALVLRDETRRDP